MITTEVFGNKFSSYSLFIYATEVLKQLELLAGVSAQKNSKSVKIFPHCYHFQALLSLWLILIICLKMPEDK